MDSVQLQPRVRLKLKCPNLGDDIREMNTSYAVTFNKRLSNTNVRGKQIIPSSNFSKCLDTFDSDCVMLCREYETPAMWIVSGNEKNLANPRLIPEAICPRKLPTR